MLYQKSNISIINIIIIFSGLVATVLYCIQYCHHSWNSEIILDFNIILMWMMSYSAHCPYLILMYMSCCTKFQICHYISILVWGDHTLMSAFLFEHQRPVCSLFLMTNVPLPALWLEGIICHSRQVKVFKRLSLIHI